MLWYNGSTMNDNETYRNRKKTTACWMALILIGTLFFLSIYGAFIGASRAKSFFNSPLLIVIWLTLTAGLIFSLTASRRLLRSIGLLLMHVGAVSVLTGAMWGSAGAHNIRAKLFGNQKIQTGQMIIYEGHEEKHVISETGEKIIELPFSIKLKDFRIEYYKPSYLQIQSRDSRSWTLPVEIGNEVLLDSDLSSITVVRSFENFRIKVEGDKNTAIDSNGPGSNPALELQLKDPNDNTTTKYVFERFTSHVRPEDKLAFGYYRIPRDYISELQVIKDGKILAEKNIEVNHPLHFGGYHFYQQSYDTENEMYTVLMVVSDNGLYLVYAGYVMLCVGVFQNFWLKDIFKKKKVANRWQSNTQYKAC
jgi:hypothetical protein